ncbi:MAG: hypothetical protein QOF84_2739 [Streptomyces sp.]|jgi:hypothetical protein|nr:hypothetical protein [Streptomyces sp.]
MRITNDLGVDVVGAGLRRRPRLSNTPRTPADADAGCAYGNTRYLGDGACAGSARSAGSWRTALVMAPLAMTTDWA